MKKQILLLLILFGIKGLGQGIPPGINYQAIALDNQGVPIPGVDIVGRPINGAEIGVRISIIEDIASENLLYQEEHIVTTDLYGMFNLVIGTGNPLTLDTFSDLDWRGERFLKIELSIENDNSYILSAVQQLMSVPYSFLTDRAIESLTALDNHDLDSTNEIQALSISHDTIFLSNGGYVKLPAGFDGSSAPENNFNGDYLTSHGLITTSPLDSMIWIVPEGITEIQVIHFGSNGGASGQWCAQTGGNGCSWPRSNGPGGLGMDVSFKLNVNPGDSIAIINGQNGIDLPNGYRGGGTVGNSGSLSEVFVNNQRLIYSEGAQGGIRANNPSYGNDGVQGQAGSIFLYGDSGTGINGTSLNNSFNGGLANYGLIDFQIGTDLTIRNLSGESAKTFIAF